MVTLLQLSSCHVHRENNHYNDFCIYSLTNTYHTNNHDSDFCIPFTDTDWPHCMPCSCLFTRRGIACHLHNTAQQYHQARPIFAISIIPHTCPVLVWMCIEWISPPPHSYENSKTINYILSLFILRMLA